MIITNITDDHDNITEYDNTTDTNNCNIDIIVPALLFTIPCGLSFLCLISLMIYTLIKALLNKKINYNKWRRFYIQLILSVVL